MASIHLPAKAGFAPQGSLGTKLIKEKGLYSSRSDFIRDAIRARLIEVKRVIVEEPVSEEVEEEPVVHELMEHWVREHEERRYTGVH